MKKTSSFFCQIVVLFLTTVLLTSNVQAGNLASIVNTNTINSNQTLTLTVKYDEKVESSILNIEALKKDFDVLGVRPQSSSSTSIVNGKVIKQQSTEWKISLAAKRQGKLTIPSFNINGDLSQEVIIDVNDNNNVAAAQELQISVSTDSDSAYEAQQLILILELSAAQGLSGLSLSEFDIDGAEIKELGQQSDQSIDNGVIRNLITVRFAVFPTGPGVITIPEIRLTAIKGRQRNFFGDVGGKQVLARSTAFNVNVKAKDNTYSPWFPAKEVVIDSAWSGDTNAVVAGEPITRTLTISALGQEGSAIPPLQRSAENGYKSYKDQVNIDDKLTYKGFIGQRVESEAIVVSNSGKLTLPAITMKWWDTQNGVWQEAVVPEQTLTVLPGKSTTQDTNNTSSPNIEPITAPSNGVVQTEYKTHWLWKLISALLLIVCLIQASFLWKLKSAPNTKITNASPNKNHSEKSTWLALQKSIKTNNPVEIRQTLQDWAQTLSSDNKKQTINDLEDYLSNNEDKLKLSNSITELERCLYKEEKTFDSSDLLNQLQKLREEIQSTNSTQSKTNTLAPLYNA